MNLLSKEEKVFFFPPRFSASPLGNFYMVVPHSFKKNLHIAKVSNTLVRFIWHANPLLLCVKTLVTTGTLGSGTSGRETEKENDILMCNENLIYYGNSHSARASNNSFF